MNRSQPIARVTKQATRHRKELVRLVKRLDQIANELELMEIEIAALDTNTALLPQAGPARIH